MCVYIYIYIYIYIYVCVCVCVYVYIGGQDSVVGIATCYRLDGRGNRIPVGLRSFAPFQTGPGAHPATYTMGTGSLFQG